MTNTTNTINTTNTTDTANKNNTEGGLQYFLSTLFGGSSTNTSPTEENNTNKSNTTSANVKLLPFHICGVHDRKTRLANCISGTGTGKTSRSSAITTVYCPLKEKKEDNTVGVLKSQIMKDLNVPDGCEIKLFYGGKELEKDSQPLFLYVLEQNRDVLFDPHIVVALKEGKVVKSKPSENPEERKIEEKKEESKVEEKKRRC